MNSAPFWSSFLLGVFSVVIRETNDYSELDMSGTFQQQTDRGKMLQVLPLKCKKVFHDRKFLT